MGDSSISTFLHQAKYIVDKLTTVGHPISLISFNATIFNNLNNNYSEMAPALSAHCNPISYSELHSLLKSHEICLAAKQFSASSLIPVANIIHASTLKKTKVHLFQEMFPFWSLLWVIDIVILVQYVNLWP